MSKSIFDTRFTSKKMALDAAVKEAFVALDAAEDDEQWITVRGAHILIDGNGKVVGGANGKFNGQNFAMAAANAAQEQEETDRAVRKIKAVNAEKEKYNKLKRDADSDEDFTHMSKLQIETEMERLKGQRAEAAKIYGNYLDEDIAEGAQKAMTKFDEKYEQAEDELAARDYRKKADEERADSRWDKVNKKTREAAAEKMYAISRELNSGYYTAANGEDKKIGSRMRKEMWRERNYYKRFAGLKFHLEDD